MKIYQASVKKPISTIIIFIGVIVFGMFSLRNLSIDLYPEMDFPVISVFTSYPGASAADIETNITKILEDNLNSVNKLKKLTSKSYDNFSLISVEFEWGTNLDEASNDIRDAMGRVEPLLPEDAEKPAIFKFSSSMIPVLFLSATAEESYPAIKKILDEKIVNPLNRIDGVGAVTISGAPTREVQVNLDPIKMDAYHLTVEGIGQAIAAENLNMPAGSIDIGSEAFSLRIEGEFAQSDFIKNVAVSSFGGKIVYLSDVATVKDTIKKETQQVLTNGKRAVNVVVQKQSGANTVAIAKSVKKAVEELQSQLPPDIKIEVINDTSTFIQDSINSLSETVMYAFLFVILVVLFFLGRWRATFIICLTIPVSLITSFIYMYLTGGSLNIITLSSLSIAIGMVVDDAIVVLENITKHLERGSSPRESAVYGTNEVWLAVIATSLVVIAVFLPLSMVGGMAGILFKPFGWIVSIVIAVSTIAAVTLTPMLSAKLLNAQRVHSYKGLGIVFKPIDRFLDKLDNVYAKGLTWAVHHRTFLIITCLLIFIFSIFLVTRVPSEFMPQPDNEQISATIELQQGTNFEVTKEVSKRIQEMLKKNYPEMEILSATCGAADGSNIWAAFQKSGTHVINYSLRFSKLAQRKRDIFEMGDLMRKDFTQFPEIVKYTVTPGGNQGGGMMGGGNTVDVLIFGYDFNVTGAFAERIADSIRKNVPGTRDVVLSRDPMQPEYRVEFDREKLSYYGISMTAASSFVRNRINGLTATKYREEGDEYDVVVRYDEPFRKSIENIENITLYTNKQQPVRVSDMGKVVERFSPPTIEHENRQRVIKVQTGMYGAALGDVVKGINAELKKVDMPQNVSVSIGGAAKDQAESFGDMFVLLILIIVLVYIVMATQFESLRMPFIIMMSLPFAFTGVFLALFITNTPLSLIALIGAIMLVGIVVKNGIVMVDFTNLLRERGMSVRQAVIAAGKSRLRPVLMTTLTTILGMLPLAAGSGEGSAIWKPMGIAIIGGLTFSTVLTLIIVPIVYTVFGAAGLKRQRRKQRRMMREISGEQLAEEIK